MTSASESPKPHAISGEHPDMRLRLVTQDSNRILLAIQEAMSRSDFASAEALASGALARSPIDTELLHLLGCAQLQQNRFDAAREVLARAVTLEPRHPVISYNYGNACGALGDFHAAARAMMIATSLPRLASDAWFKIGTALGHSHQWQAAAAAMLLASRAESDHVEAMKGMGACALQLIRRGDRAPPRKRSPPASGKLSVVVCSIKPEKAERLRTRLARLLRSEPWELVTITDARSLCEGYNRGLDASTGDLIVFCHDDILLLADDFEQRLRGYLSEFELIGVAGATQINGPNWTMSGPPHIHCWIGHLDEQARPILLLLGNRGPFVPNARVLDGVFLAGRRSVFERNRFDSDTFDGFHLYDIDFTYRAWLAGVNQAVCLDLGVLHESNGNYDELWRHYADRFLQKFAGRIDLSMPALKVGSALLDYPEQLGQMQDWMACWTMETNASLERTVRGAVMRI